MMKIGHQLYKFRILQNKTISYIRRLYLVWISHILLGGWASYDNLFNKRYMKGKPI